MQACVRMSHQAERLRRRRALCVCVGLLALLSVAALLWLMCSTRPRFVESPCWKGARKGMYFGTGVRGTGYYALSAASEK